MPCTPTPEPSTQFLVSGDLDGALHLWDPHLFGQKGGALLVTLSLFLRSSPQERRTLSP